MKDQLLGDQSAVEMQCQSDMKKLQGRKKRACEWMWFSISTAGQVAEAFSSVAGSLGAVADKEARGRTSSSRLEPPESAFGEVRSV